MDASIRGRRRRGQLSALLLAVLVLVLPATAGAVPVWLTPQDVSAVGQDAYAPQVALDASGDAIAVWTRSSGGNYITQASRRPAGGAWSAPQDLSLPGKDPNVPPQVAVNASGSAVAVWQRGDGTNDRVQASLRPAGGTWTSAQDISTAGQLAITPQVAIDGAGNAFAIWAARSDGANFIVQAAVRPAGGAWSAPQDLSVSGQSAGEPQIALDSSGNAIAVWARSDGTNSIVQAARRPAGGAWSAPQDLSAAGRGAGEPQVAFGGTGDAIAVWVRRNDGVYYTVQAAARPAGGVWSASQDLSVAGQNALEPQVALDPSGNAAAVWARSDGSHEIVQAARRPPGGPWSSPQDLSAAGQAAASSQVAIDQGGDVIAVWERSDGSHYIVQAARRTAVGNWRAPEDLSTAGKDADFPQVAFDAAGNAVTVWSRSNGMNLIVQASALDASGPVFGGLTIPASGTAGMPLSFAVSPFDVWSALGPGPVWSFGDGAMGAGNSVAHAYAAAGTYKVTLSQADSLGNLSSVSRNISIAAAPPPPPPPPPPPVKHCVVPKVVGKKLIRAKVAIKRAHCRTGKVTRRYAKNKRGLVIAQKPKARRHLRVGAKVNLVVSKGRRRR